MKGKKKKKSPVINWPYPVFWLVVFVSRDPEEGIRRARVGGQNDCAKQMVFIAKAFKCEKSYRIKILINGAKLPTIWIFRHSHFPRKKKKHACYHLNMWSIRVSVSPLSVILFLLPVLGQFDSLTLYYVRTIYIYIYI